MWEENREYYLPIPQHENQISHMTLYVKKESYLTWWIERQTLLLKYWCISERSGKIFEVCPWFWSIIDSGFNDFHFIQMTIFQNSDGAGSIFKAINQVFSYSWFLNFYRSDDKIIILYLSIRNNQMDQKKHIMISHDRLDFAQVLVVKSQIIISFLL